MDDLFAPWRIEWVKQEDRDPSGACVFCEFTAAGNDRDRLIVARSEANYVLLNNYPYNPGHVMIIPNRHIEGMTEFTDEELLDHGRLTQELVSALTSVMNPDGFNTGCNIGRAGGGSIDHLHTHIVPRWSGDTNFMAVIDDTKVIVEALDETYDRLHDVLTEQSSGSADAESGVHFTFD